MNPPIATASTWTADITAAAVQIVEDCGVGIAAGLTIFIVVFGVRKVKGAMKAGS